MSMLMIYLLVEVLQVGFYPLCPYSSVSLIWSDINFKALTAKITF